MVKKYTFLRKGHQKIYHPLFSPFGKCFASNKDLDNFHKKVQHPIARRIEGRDLGLQSYQTKSFCNRSLLSAELLKPFLTETKLTIFVAATPFWYLCSFFFQKISIHTSCVFTKPVQNLKILFFILEKIHAKYTKVYQYTKKPFIVKYSQPVPPI